MPAQVMLFEPPHGVVVVPGTIGALGDADADATVVPVREEGFEPFDLWMQLTPISDIRLARGYVQGEAGSWVGALHAPLIGTGLEWFSPASDEHEDSRWSAVFADDGLFVSLTLRSASFAELVARRALVVSTVLPSLVIADGAEPWNSDETLGSGLVVAPEPWPQLARRATA